MCSKCVLKELILLEGKEKSFTFEDAQRQKNKKGHETMSFPRFIRPLQRGYPK